MTDYDIANNIDVIIRYSCAIDLGDEAKLKIYELTKSNRFENWISNRTRIEIIRDGNPEHKEILEKDGYMFYE